MQIPGAFSDSSQSLDKVVRDLESKASEITRDTTPIARTNTHEPPKQPLYELNDSLVGMKQDVNQFQAVAKVAKTADEILGTVIDLKA